MGIKPLMGRVLIKRIETKNVAGLFLAKGSEEKSSRGEVLAIGEFEKDKSVDIKVGDVVIYPSWSGTNISSDADDSLVIVKAEEILGVEE